MAVHRAILCPVRRRMGGFTLLELVVVLVIAGMLLALVPLALGRASESAELRATTRRLVSGLKLARAQAAVTQKSAVFVIHVGEKWMRVEDRQHPFPAHIAVDLRTAAQDIDGDLAAFRFFPDGSATGGHITLTSGNVSYRVNVDWVTGKVEVADEDAS